MHNLRTRFFTFINPPINFSHPSSNRNPSEENTNGSNDSSLDGIDRLSVQNIDNKEIFNLLYTNARSIAPKMECFLDYLEEMDTSVAILTETWLNDGSGLDEDLAEIEKGTGYGMIVKNRPINQRGYSTGGVAIVYKTNRIKFRELKLPGNKFEIVCGAGSLIHHARKVVAIAVYIPPQNSAEESRECLDFLEESVIHIKGMFKDPYIIVSGDFNRRDVDQSLANFPDLKLINTPPTRGAQKLDKLFINFNSQIFESGILKPLENDRGVRSDHAVIYVSAKLKRIESFKWIKHTYKKYSDETANKFKDWIVTHDWEGVFTSRSSTEKAKVYDDTCKWAMEHFFPDVTVKRKSTDDPWINKNITDLIEKRGKMFRRFGERKRE